MRTMVDYTPPAISELGTIADFTRGESFAWTLDGMTLSELVGHVIDGGNPGDGLGYS